MYGPFLFNNIIAMKQRMQIAPKNLKNYRKLVKLTYKNEGIQAFYRSYPVTLVKYFIMLNLTSCNLKFMNVPHAAILIGINETLKHSYKPEGGHSILSYLLCASIAGKQYLLVSTKRINYRIISCY